MGVQKLTEEMVVQAIEKRKTRTLQSVADELGVSANCLSVRISRYKDTNGIAPEERANERDIPVAMYQRFGEICEELKKKAKPERLEQIKIVKGRYAWK